MTALYYVERINVKHAEDGESHPGAEIIVTIPFAETETREAVKALGYKWNSAYKHWRVASRWDTMREKVAKLEALNIQPDNEHSVGFRYRTPERIMAEIEADRGDWALFKVHHEEKLAASARVQRSKNGEKQIG